MQTHTSLVFLLLCLLLPESEQMYTYQTNNNLLTQPQKHFGVLTETIRQQFLNDSSKHHKILTTAEMQRTF